MQQEHFGQYQKKQNYIHNIVMEFRKNLPQMTINLLHFKEHK